ncbi:hypothetical protein BE221DRAFT_69524 [Ostreococcus tauri]|uniref:Uncharacterized protein n=1 Tax=Ostreococcus tauri TaxID=70448 RepID=A0A1Y5IE30_OSTTA|nr:hypothetical protein BE221DRAFT_69524 [Ostreococcus tauri]
MKAKAPQAQGMKWMARVKRRVKRDEDERAADEGTKAVTRALKTEKAKKKGKKKKLASYTVSVSSIRGDGAASGAPRRATQTSAARETISSTPRYASGNPFAALAGMSKKR